MWIDALSTEDLFSHRKTAVEFDRAKAISLFVGKNWSGKSSTARAIELALTGEVFGLRGAGATVEDMIRTGARSGSVSLMIRPAPDAKPIEIRRRVTKSVITSVNGSPATKAVYDLLARIHGDADPAAVFQVLCNVTGFFDLSAAPQETARRQKALLMGLIDQSVPAETFGAWPLSFGAVPTTFGGVLEAYGLVSARLTEVNREVSRITLDPAALAGEPVTEALISQIQAQIADVRGQKEQRIAAQGDAAGRRALLTAALAEQRAGLAEQRLQLAQRGPRPKAPVIEDRQAHAQRMVDVGREHADQLRRQSEISARYQGLSMVRQRLAYRLADFETQQRTQPTLEAAQAALVDSLERLGNARVEQGAWQERASALEALSVRLAEVERRFALLTSSPDGPCIACRRPMNAPERGVAAQSFAAEAVALEGEIEQASRDLGSRPDSEHDLRLVREREGVVAAVRALEEKAADLEREIAEIDTALLAIPPAGPEIERLGVEHSELCAALALVEKAEVYDALTEAIHAQGIAVAETERSLAALPEEDSEIAVLADRLTRGEAALVEARSRRDARQRAEQAEIAAGRLAAEVDALTVLRDQLGPKGVREHLLLARLDTLTARVNEVLAYFGLALTFAGDPWAVLLNGQPPALMSETERMQAGLAFQVALAEVTGARWLMCDRIGNLDYDNRGALFGVLDLGLSRGWIEQCFLFSTFTSATPPVQAPAENVALFHVTRIGEGWTTIARVA